MSDEQPRSPEEVRAERRRAKIKGYQDLFNTPLGSKVLGDMMNAHGFKSPHPADPIQMAMKEGERLVVLRILTFLQINPTELRERMNSDEVL